MLSKLHLECYEQLFCKGPLRPLTPLILTQLSVQTSALNTCFCPDAPTVATLRELFQEEVERRRDGVPACPSRSLALTFQQMRSEQMRSVCLRCGGGSLGNPKSGAAYALQPTQHRRLWQPQGG